jgi:hypothetical protein
MERLVAANTLVIVDGLFLVLSQLFVGTLFLINSYRAIRFLEANVQGSRKVTKRVSANISM